MDSQHRCDLIALVLYGSTALGYLTVFLYLYKRHPAILIQGKMNRFRRLWLKQVTDKESLLAIHTFRNLIMSSTFLASTSILLVLGLLSLLSVEKSSLVNVLQPDLKMTAEFYSWWMFKIILLVVLFTHAFFHFTQSLRDMHFLSIIAAVAAQTKDDPIREELSRDLERLFEHFAISHTHGFKSFFFSLPIFMWLVGPTFMIVASILTLYLMVRRDFAPVFKPIMRVDS